MMIGLAIIAPITALFFGAADIAVQQVISCFALTCEESIERIIFWEVRLPRVIIGFLVGATLSVVGATLQNVTRNSLADPYLFGVAAGAGLGASIAIVLLNTLSVAMNEWMSIPWLLPLSAFIGALLAVLLVSALSTTSLGNSAERMLLAGVAVSFMLTALSQFILYLGEPMAANQVMFWMMGSLARVEISYIWIILPALLVGLGLLLLNGPRLDALLLGDENAISLGINAPRLRILALCLCAALTACVVAYCGGIGFVGLMIPHIVRSWIGVTTRTLVIGCVLVGGSFLLLVDIAARSAVAGQEIPLGIMTSAIGSLFFLALMQKRIY
jgi:iron complex transport system permease protein